MLYTLYTLQTYNPTRNLHKCINLMYEGNSQPIICNCYYFPFMKKGNKKMFYNYKYLHKKTFKKEAKT